ncbi:MAG TPA: hypothetical protein VD833_08505, partial [Vicinamibacterales bacterium]|nr:hypothetical protein [Vicinamibacterales bacterium]
MLSMTPAERRQFDTHMKSSFHLGLRIVQFAVPALVDTLSFLGRQRGRGAALIVKELDARVTIRRHYEAKPLSSFHVRQTE